jgi:hypothetical protein
MTQHHEHELVIDRDKSAQEDVATASVKGTSPLGKPHAN